MNVMSYDMELLVLGPDKDTQFLVDGLLSKAPSLGVRVPSHRIDIHPLRDAGCLDADELLESQTKRYAHALVITNAERSGRMDHPREVLEARIEDKLRASGWDDRARAVVVAPGIGRWLLEHVYKERWSPGTMVQAKLEALLRRKRIPQSPELYRALGPLLIDDGEPDPAWQKILFVLKDWFAVDNVRVIAEVVEILGTSSETPDEASARTLEGALLALAQGREIAATDALVKHLDDLFLAGEFGVAGRLLARLDPQRLPPKLLSGVLMVSRAAKAALGEERTTFLERVRTALSETWHLRPEQVDSICRRHA